MFDDVCSCLVAAYRWSIVGQVLDHRAAWILQLFVGRVRCEVAVIRGRRTAELEGTRATEPVQIAAIASLRLARPTPVATALMHLKD